MTLLFEIVEGPGRGTQVPLSAGAGTVLGRDAGCDVTLADDNVSRRHARLLARNGTAVVEDLGSTNGTFVNGEQIHGPVSLSPGDHLLVGVSVLELRTSADLSARGTAVRPRPPAFAIPAETPDYVPPEIVLPDRHARGHRLDPLLDASTKRRARVAPLGLTLLVVFAIILFLALR